MKAKLFFLAASTMVAVPLLAESGSSACLAGLPPEADPVTVGGRIVAQFLSTQPDAYFPKGATRLHCKGYVPYAVVSLWVNALELAENTGNLEMQKRLTDLFKPYLGEKKGACPVRNHVDFSIFGAVPLVVGRLTHDKALLDFGIGYAEKQWMRPGPDVPLYIMKEETFLEPERIRLWERGYTAQTRFWIDDMYMITMLQTQAWRSTGDKKYLDRAGKEMVLYLDRLQLKEGPAAGLFYHAPDAPFVWGRGAGWMAGGMALILRHLPENSEWRKPIHEGYMKMMSALLKFQRDDGLWGQLVNEPTSWGESSGSAMFTYAFITGVRKGWLDPKTYGPAARKAWIALCGKLDAYANLPDICIGTGKRNDHQYYLDRPRLNGDPHGQAPMLWCANALVDKGN